MLAICPPYSSACENVYLGGGHITYHVRRESTPNLPPARQSEPGSASDRIVEGELASSAPSDGGDGPLERKYVRMCLRTLF